MDFRISRQEFLKLAGLGTALTVGLAGGKWVIDQGFFEDPFRLETYTATTCSGCSRGCGIKVLSRQGDILHITGNPDHPLCKEMVCSRMSSGLKQLYSPQRIAGPLQKPSQSLHPFESLDWDNAGKVIQAVFKDYQPGEIAFLLGTFPDHLYDLVRLISDQVGGMHVLRYSSQDQWTGQTTLMDAAQRVFGMRALPYFDTRHAQIVFSFGDQFAQPWIAEPSVSDAYWVHFGMQKPKASKKADEFYAMSPANTLPVLRILSQMVADQQEELRFSTVLETDLEMTAESCGIGLQDFHRLAKQFSRAERKIALPGASLLGSSAGLAAARSVLGLNVLAGAHGQAGEIYLLPDLPVLKSRSYFGSTIAGMDALLSRLRSGRIKVLFVHGADPLLELPAAYEAAQALDMAERVISFSPLKDATSLKADYIFPDHTALESWGYQKLTAGSDRPGLSAIQPVLPPRMNTRSTVDLLLQSLHSMGVGLAFTNELDFIQSKIAPLIDQGGVYSAGDQAALWSGWLKTGGWWKSARSLLPAVAAQPASHVRYAAESPLVLPDIGDGLQLVLYPMDNSKLTKEISTVDVFVHPHTARELGLRPGQKVSVCSSAGSLVANIQANPLLSPGTAALPRQTGLDLVGRQQNVSGGLAWSGIRVIISPS